MKVVSITDVRQEATSLVEHAQKSREPVLICIRSRPVAYIVDAQAYESMQDDLRRLRHELFWQGVEEAEVEHQAGQSRTYDSADELIADLDLEATQGDGEG